MSETFRKAYPRDLADLQWEMIELVLPKPRRSTKGGRPQTVDFREVINTILYQCRSGCQWEMLPHDLLPKSTVYDYFKRWRDDGPNGYEGAFSYSAAGNVLSATVDSNGSTMGRYVVYSDGATDLQAVDVLYNASSGDVDASLSTT